MKRCCTCGVTKALEEFHRRSASADGRQARCKACFRAQYAADTEAMRRKAQERSRRVRREKDAALVAYLSEHPCVDCGEADLRVLDFDHRDETEKSRGVAQMLLGGWSWRAMLAEIEKCDVRCANCHRKRTAERAGWRKHVAQRAADEARERELARHSELSAQRLARVLGRAVPTGPG